MRIKKVELHSDLLKISCVKKTREIEFTLPSAKLRPRPTLENPIVEFHIDRELGDQGIEYLLKDGTPGAVHLDAFREYSCDPEFFRELIVYKATILLEKVSKTSQFSKSEIAQRLNTSPTQIYRTFDSNYYGKTVDQIVKVLAAMGHTLDVSLIKIENNVDQTPEEILKKLNDITMDQKTHTTGNPFRGLSMGRAS